MSANQWVGMNETYIQRYIKQIVFPKAQSHKGDNGRVLVIGGSKLFHAAAFWAASAASKIVDLVHFSSPAMENNELMRVRAKEKFWDGIVIPYENIEHYIKEDDVILIGPGMPRDEGLMAGEKSTGYVVNGFLAKYPDKKWVLDGGALQVVDTALIRPQMILTPNEKELAYLFAQADLHGNALLSASHVARVAELSLAFGGVTIIAKGQTDIVSQGHETIEVAGGSAGMTKGGTGDVLAGIVCALYAKSPALSAAVTASLINKKASEKLAETNGPFFSAGDLIPAVLQTFHTLLHTVE